MAYVKTDWENLPSTDTPITETALDNIENGIEYNDQRLNGTKPMGSIVVDDVSCKNMFIPTLYSGSTAILPVNGTVTLSGDEFTFVASGSDMYFGQAGSANSNYNENYGILIDVEGLNKISFNITNSAFNKNFISSWNSSKVGIERMAFLSNTGTYTLPANTKYISFRIGKGDAVSGTTYKTKVQVEAGDTATSYTPYKAFDNQEVYSLGETKIGTYDGETLYRQTIVATPNIASGTAASSFTIPIANVDQVFIKDMTKIADTSSSGYVYGFPFFTGSASIGGYISVGASNLTFNVRKTTNVGFYSIKLVLEYTKTTSGTRSIETVEEENR